MNVSKLDEIYSFSSSFTSKEMTLKIPDYDLQSQIENMEPSKYIDRFTGKAKNEIVIHRSKCPLCDSDHFEFLFVKHGFDHVLCSKCDLIFTLQILDHERIKFLEVGGEGDNYGNYKSTSAVSDRDKKKYEIVFDELSKYSSIKKIFDIGSNAGMFLDWAKSQNYSTTGHEFHDKLRNDCISKGHFVLNENLDTIQFDEVDLITCWDYIDHVLNPKEMVDKLPNPLSKNMKILQAI